MAIVVPNRGIQDEMPDVQYSSNNADWSDSFSEGTTRYLRFRIGDTGEWSDGVRFVGGDAPGLIIEFSSDNMNWGSYTSGDTYIRFSTDAGNSYSTGIQFTGPTGEDGESLQVEYSSDNSNFHDTLDTADNYIRFRIGDSGTWSTGIQFVGTDGSDGDSVEIQYSSDNSSFHDTLADADRYIRFRVGSSGTWSTGIQFVGDDGDAGPAGATGQTGQTGATGDSVEIQYSSDNTNFHDTLVDADRYIRFRVGSSGTWSTGIQFVGDDGDTGQQGETGAAAPNVIIQFSSDNVNWHATYDEGDVYIRFSVDGGSNYTTGVEFVGGVGSDSVTRLDVTTQTGLAHGQSHVLTYATPVTVKGNALVTVGSNGNITFLKAGTYSIDASIEIRSNPGATSFRSNAYLDIIKVGTTDTFTSSNTYTRYNSDIAYLTLHSSTFVVAADNDQYQIRIRDDEGESGITLDVRTNSDIFIGYKFGGPAGEAGPTGSTGPAGDSVQIQYSSDNSDFHDALANTDSYIRFRVGDSGTWSTGVQFVGDDGNTGPTGPTGPMGATGSDGESVQVQYSSDNSNFHDALANTDTYIRFRVGSTSNWSTGVQFVGDDGADGATGPAGSDGDSVQVQYSSDDSNFHGTLASGDKYIRFRVGDSGDWSTGIQFVGDDGDTGAAGDSVQIQYSSDNSDFHDALANTDSYIRFRVGDSGTWSTGIQFVGDDGDTGAAGDSVEIQYSVDDSGDSSYHDTFATSDKYIRFRVGSSGTWSSGIQFVGDDGTNAPNVIIQFSADNSTWETTYENGDTYIRFSVDNGNNYTSGVQFVGGNTDSVTRLDVTGQSDLAVRQHHVLTYSDPTTVKGEALVTVASNGTITFLKAGTYSLDAFVRYETNTPTGSFHRSNPYLDVIKVGTTDTLVSGNTYTRFQDDAAYLTFHSSTFVVAVDNDQYQIRMRDDIGDDGITLDILSSSDIFIGLKFGGPAGLDGESLSVQYSDDNSSFHDTLVSTDRYIRFRIGDSGDWSTGIQFAGQPGPAGSDGDSVQIQYSSDNSDFHDALANTDTYIRFRVGDSGTWSTGVQFVGDDGDTGPAGATGQTGQTGATGAAGDLSTDTVFF